MGSLLPFLLTLGTKVTSMLSLTPLFLPCLQPKLYLQGSTQGPLLQEAFLGTRGLSPSALFCLRTFKKWFFEIESHFITLTA